MDILDILELENNYVLQTYAPSPISFVSGKGCYLEDSEGNQYLDFLAGIAVCSLGHCHPSITDTIVKQSNKVIHTSNYFLNNYRGSLAKNLVADTHFQRVFFCNSGAEANECALKVAKKYLKIHTPEKIKIVTAVNSFHGRTLATVTATGQSKYNLPFTPLPDWFVYIPYNDEMALREALSDPSVGALLLEPIQGEGGVIVATDSYLKLARELTAQNNQLLILDEVQTGIMRTGKMYAYMHYNIEPDIITLAKGLGGGFPVGACLMTQKVASVMQVGDHGTTFGSNPLAMAVGLTVYEELHKKEFLENLENSINYFNERLKELYFYPFVKDIRGKGLMIGIELEEDYSSKELFKKLLQNKLIISCAGNNTLRIIPPLNITTLDIDKFFTIFYKTIEEQN